MEPRDYENIKFILSKTPAELFDWWESLDDEDRMYAVEIVRIYNKELLNDLSNVDKVLEKEFPLRYVELELDTTEAKEYLKKFQLQK